jgi:DNA polymerase III delta prime subunit
LKVAEIRQIASRYSPEEIEHCIAEQLQRGQNICIRGRPAQEIINELAKAEFVRELMERQGLSLAEALRELARRMRTVQALAKED